MGHCVVMGQLIGKDQNFGSAKSSWMESGPLKSGKLKDSNMFLPMSACMHCTGGHE